MTSLMLTGIAELVTNDPAHDGTPYGIVEDAAVVVEGGRVSWVGRRTDAPAADAARDLGGRAVVPGFVDSHSHLVFAGDRAPEFAARMAGESYAAGGIRTTVAATRAATDEQLAANVARLVAEMRRQGTTTVEIKSGYGLTTLDEARGLAIARQFTDETTFLGAHVVPPEYAEDPAGYVDLVTGPMLEAAAPHARWIDVFCERGAFDADQARTILAAGQEKGLAGRLHANQLGPGPGVRLACELGLTAVDHCTFLDEADLSALADSGTVATLLARRRVQHPVAVPRCPCPARRRRHGRAGQRLQPRFLLHLVHGAVRRPGGPGDADDPGRGGLVGHRGRCGGAGPRRRRRARARQAGPPGRPGGPLARPSRLPARRSPGRRGPCVSRPELD